MSRKPFVAAGLVCLLALSVGCGQDAPTPVSPTTTADVTDTSANADGSNLKATAPTPQSPINGAQTEGEVVLTIGNSEAKFASVPLSYRFEVFDDRNEKVYTSGLIQAGNGRTQHAVGGTLEFAKTHTWRARAEYLGAVGPWSAAASFKTPEGGYIRGNEVLDPLTNGKTVGEVHGPVTFIQGQGAKIESNLSRITYELAQTLQEGEYSFVAQGVDEGNNGDKTKVMSMAEGPGDVTDNDYRASLEVRGQDYGGAPGTVAFRMITGDAGDHGRIHDTQRRVVSWSRQQTYFFRIWWRFGQGGYEIRVGGPDGPMHDQASLGLGGRYYRPGHDGTNHHFVHVGAPNTRAGEANASHPQMTVRNGWISPRPRPRF
jgi:hypothetical protein